LSADFFNRQIFNSLPDPLKGLLQSTKNSKILLQGHLITSIMAALSLLQITDLHILQNLEETLLGINTDIISMPYLNSPLRTSSFDLILVTGDLGSRSLPGELPAHPEQPGSHEHTVHLPARES